MVETIEDKEMVGDFEGFTPFELRMSNFWVAGTYQHKEDRICISNAYCEGKLKVFMNYLVTKFRTNKVLIYNVLSTNWHLRGFKPEIITDPYFKESVFCLVGEWETVAHKECPPYVTNK